MWWEYAIVTVCLVVAAGYVIWTLRRAMSGAGSCGTGDCGKSRSSDRHKDAGVAPKVTPLVQIRKPGE